MPITARMYAVAGVLAGVLALVILAMGSPGGGEAERPPAAIDCRYENPELKSYADRIPSCLP